MKELIGDKNLAVLLTYQCNANCSICFERDVNKFQGFMTADNFAKALGYGKEYGLEKIYLHGGEPTLHPALKDFALQARAEGFKTIMFTNYLRPDIFYSLDGLVDEMIISNYNQKNLPNQKDFESKLVLSTVVSKNRFANLAELDKYIYKKEKLGMQLRFITMKPSTKWAANNAAVDYLEEMFDRTADSDIYTFRGKAALFYRDCIIKFNNKRILQFHSWNVTPDGEFREKYPRDHFYQPEVGAKPLSDWRKDRERG
ncbi:MAG: radical SAM protein [Rickettsiales bacterium]|jgi:organic radical activating enzyme|nr:radical SAM protein [Rickettsiales bacterium]